MFWALKMAHILGKIILTTIDLFGSLLLVLNVLVEVVKILRMFMWLFGIESGWYLTNALNIKSLQFSMLVYEKI